MGKTAISYNFAEVANEGLADAASLVCGVNAEDAKLTTRRFSFDRDLLHEVEQAEEPLEAP